MLSDVNIDLPAGVHACNMGSGTETPCRFPAVETDPNSDAALCRFHVGMVELRDESDELAVALERLEGFSKEAGKSGPLADEFERLRGDFAHRKGVLDYALKNLEEAEMTHMRG